MDTSTKPSVALRDASVVAARAAAEVAIARAAENAAKPGKHTSELWASVLAPALTIGAMTLIKTLGIAAAVSMPWAAIPLAGAAAAIATFGYSASRGNVKTAAISAGSAALSAAETETLRQLSAQLPAPPTSAM